MDILEKLKEAMVEAYGDSIDLSMVTPETDLREDLGLNSIGMLSVAISIEEKFGFRFANDDFGSIKTVNDIMEIIKKYQK